MTNVDFNFELWSFLTTHLSNIWFTNNNKNNRNSIRTYELCHQLFNFYPDLLYYGKKWFTPWLSVSGGVSGKFAVLWMFLCELFTLFKSNISACLARKFLTYFPHMFPTQSSSELFLTIYLQIIVNCNYCPMIYEKFAAACVI